MVVPDMVAIPLLFQDSVKAVPESMTGPISDRATNL